MAPLKNGSLYGLGLTVLALASLRHRVGGYRRPTDFPASDWPRAAAHALGIVQDWQHHLREAGGPPASFAQRDVLELGPGATLGTGVLLTGLGIRSYRAVDAFPLAARTPPGFYRALATADLPAEFDRDRIHAAVEALERGEPGPVAYVTDPGFRIVEAAEGRSFDLIVSNAAFEHFEDVESVLAQVTQVARPGARFVAGVDFQTHSRGIRAIDPNGIYRFSPRLWRRLAYPGQPNRVRPEAYLRTLRALGWKNVACRSVDIAPSGYLAWSMPGLDPVFRKENSGMEVLTGIVLAEKP